jgi:thioesterase domain-containing protein
MKYEHRGDLTSKLEEYLLEHIPISSAMGVSVQLATSNKIVLRASFVNNINHMKTVFGGSLHAVATLACWSLLHVNLMDLLGKGVQIVIASSEVEYLLPVTTDFQTECCMPEVLDWGRFVKMLQKKGKARIKLYAKIFQEGHLCVDYTGVFVAISTIKGQSKAFNSHEIC